MLALKNKKYTSMVKKSLLSLVVILLMAGTIVLSMLSNKQIYNQYHTLIDSQIYIIDFSTKLDSINNRLSLGYMYQQYDKLEGIRKAIKEARRDNNILKKKSFMVSRSFVDYCNMVDTYLDECTELVESIEQAEVEINLTISDTKAQELLKEFELVQYTISYINITFKAVFSEEVSQIRSVEADISSRYVKIYSIIIILLVVASLISFFYVKSISKTATQLKTLMVFACKVRNNPYLQEEVNISSNDELALFAMAFDEMVKTIQKQMSKIQENAKIRERLKNAEIERLEMNGVLQTSRLQLLQSRINPHFLFNTLNMIKSTAISEGAKVSYELIETTSTLLQYNLTNLSVPVRVSDEIDNIRNYIALQTRRFGNRIEYTFNIGEQEINQHIPAMVLQPLVENAITHGLKEMSRGGKIDISAIREGEQLLLVVCDNGDGFDENQKQQILMECESKDISNRIGLRNVYQRLLYFYKGDVEIILNSSPGETKIGFSLPARRLYDNIGDSG